MNILFYICNVNLFKLTLYYPVIFTTTSNTNFCFYSVIYNYTVAPPPLIRPLPLKTTPLVRPDSCFSGFPINNYDRLLIGQLFEFFQIDNFKLFSDF